MIERALTPAEQSDLGDLVQDFVKAEAEGNHKAAYDISVKAVAAFGEIYWEAANDWHRLNGGA